MGLLIFWLILCVMVGALSHSRGNGFGLLFFLSLILSPLVGLIIALLQKPKAQADREIAQRAGSYGEYRKCPFCAEVIRAEAVKCRYCGSEVPPTPPPAPPIPLWNQNPPGVQTPRVEVPVMEPPAAPSKPLVQQQSSNEISELVVRLVIIVTILVGLAAAYFWLRT